jgi:hypothetical protein
MIQTQSSVFTGRTYRSGAVCASSAQPIVSKFQVFPSPARATKRVLSLSEEIIFLSILSTPCGKQGMRPSTGAQIDVVSLNTDRLVSFLYHLEPRDATK